MNLQYHNDHVPELIMLHIYLFVDLKIKHFVMAIFIFALGQKCVLQLILIVI